jgi:hypothetical protein
MALKPLYADHRESHSGAGAGALLKARRRLATDGVVSALEQRELVLSELRLQQSF